MESSLTGLFRNSENMLNLLNVEAIRDILLEIPSLVRLYERQDTTFISALKDWLDRMNRILLGNRLLIGMDFALYKGRIISVERGLIPNELKFRRQPSARKIKLTMCYEILLTATKTVKEVFEPILQHFIDNQERARAIVELARLKGLIDPALQATLNREQIKVIWETISKNPEFSSLFINLNVAVGQRDAFILFDRAVVS